MKIAILGTRGIPNNYGGFEQCAEKLSERWVKEGHEVTVYNPDEHSFKEPEWKGVKIKHVFSKESRFGIWGTFIYDYLCLRDAVKEDFDIILNLGYVPSALFFSLKKKTKAKFVTNMDGLEWMRKKWNSVLKRFIRYCERKALKYSDGLIFDNKGIRDYYFEHFGVDGDVIPYGAEVFNNPDTEVLKKYNVGEFEYFLLIARFEPENNIKTVIEGYLQSNAKYPLLLVGNPGTAYGKMLKKEYGSSEKVRFLGAIYNQNELGTLRMFSRLYFHGHSVGGTNPSLLEAMASRCYVVAHDNIFNRSVLGDNGLFFSDSKQLAEIINSFDERKREVFAENNVKKIIEHYNWDLMSQKYLEAFNKALN